MRLDAVDEKPTTAPAPALTWGVVPVVADLAGDVGEAADRIGAALVARGDIAPGSVVVVVSVSPELGRGPSNFLKLQRV